MRRGLARMSCIHRTAAFGTLPYNTEKRLPSPLTPVPLINIASFIQTNPATNAQSPASRIISWSLVIDRDQMGARALENVDTAAFGWVPTYLYMNTGGVHVESAQSGTKTTTNQPNFSEQDTKLKLGATATRLGPSHGRRGHHSRAWPPCPTTPATHAHPKWRFRRIGEK